MNDLCYNNSNLNLQKILFDNMNNSYTPIQYSNKSLGHADVSGEILTSNIFPEHYSPYFLDFEKIQYDKKNDSWILIDHILLENPVNSYEDVPEHIKFKIENLFSFSYMLNENSGKNVEVLISFYFSKQSPNTDLVQRLHPKDFKIFNTSTSQYAHTFKQINLRSSKKQFHNLQFYSNENIWNNRIDDSPFSFSKACLGTEYTNGFNIDKILFFPEINRCALFEYLLCESSQLVNPYTSHPNKYHNKNTFKFQSLWEFSQAIQSPVYMLNYAKEGPHVDKIKFMKFVDYQPNTKNPVITDNKDTTLNALRASIEKRFSSATTKLSF